MWRWGYWKWLNLAILVAVAFFGVREMLGLDWHDYNPAFTHTIAIPGLGCGAALDEGGQDGERVVRLRFAHKRCHDELTGASLVTQNRRIPFSGHAHAFEATVPDSARIDQIILHHRDRPDQSIAMMPTTAQPAGENIE